MNVNWVGAIERRLEELGLDDKGFAKALKVSPYRAVQIKMCSRPSNATVRQVCKALNVTPKYLGVPKPVAKLVQLGWEVRDLAIHLGTTENNAAGIITRLSDGCRVSPQTLSKVAAVMGVKPSYFYD